MLRHPALIDSRIADERRAPSPGAPGDFASPRCAAQFLRRAVVNKKSWLNAGVLTLMLTGFESLSYGLGPLPPTPCPCAADGICRPNRASWGYSQTRWRAWPGEQLSQQPTPAADSSLDAGKEQPLREFEPPLPREEDLLGPARKKVSKRTGNQDADDDAKDGGADKRATPLPGLGELPPLPGLGESPPFDPQGNRLPPVNRLEVPPMEDAPPALPASLRQAALSMIMPQPTRHRQAPATPLPVSAASTESQIRPASWNRPAIGLINPASTVTEPAANALQRAIYYEASGPNDGAAE